MQTIHINGEVEEGTNRNLEIWVDGSRRITLTIRKGGLSLQTPHSNLKVVNSGHGFYATTKDLK